jgi:hypothetical protein
LSIGNLQSSEVVDFTYVLSQGMVITSFNVKGIRKRRSKDVL